MVALAYWLSYQLRFDGGPRGVYARLLDRTWWWAVLLALGAFAVSGVPLRRWRYAGQRDYESIVRAVLVIVLLTVVLIDVLRPIHSYAHRSAVAVVLPNGVIVLYALLALVFLVGIRALARSIYERRPLAAFRGGGKDERTVLIAGAGEGGRMVLREIVRNRELGLSPVGFLDDDPGKRRLWIDGVRVRGNTEADLPQILDDAEPDEVIIAIPSAPAISTVRSSLPPPRNAASGRRS